jgi:hypothetical protein
MLTLQTGFTRRFCDGISRRNLLQIGAAGFAGLTLADLLRADDARGLAGHKGVINIHLDGGPSHQDTFDLKPEAPIEFRGEFNPIKTNVSGIEICEHFPLLAQMADKYAIIRSLTGIVDDHTNYQTHTGFSRDNLRALGGRPSIGCVVSKVLGSGAGGAPAFVSYNGGDPGFLPPAYKPYRPDGGDLRLSGSMTSERLSDRTALLSTMDRIRRDVDGSRKMEALDTFTQRAVEVVTSGRVADALDVRKEDPKVLERYGDDCRNFLTARRLIEAGVRVVTLNWGSWDTHGDNFRALKQQLPKLDRGFSALVNDLHERGLQNDIAVVLWGEFGRTPRVNNGAGRDHWPRVAMAVLAGGGMRTGQVIGSSTRLAEDPADRPVYLQEVFATLYQILGVDPHKTQINDSAGRPQYILERRDPVPELIG